MINQYPSLTPYTLLQYASVSYDLPETLSHNLHIYIPAVSDSTGYIITMNKYYHLVG